MVSLRQSKIHNRILQWNVGSFEDYEEVKQGFLYGLFRYLDMSTSSSDWVTGQRDNSASEGGRRTTPVSRNAMCMI